jgi:hypothetical protein
MASPTPQFGETFTPAAQPVPAAEVPGYPLADRPIRAVYSFVVDGAARFAYQGVHLARSLLEHAVGHPADVHVQFTPMASEPTRELFRQLGCTLHAIEPFGDGRFCNKLGQLDHLLNCECDRVVLLDTDMIVVSDPRRQLGPRAVLAKIADFGNPPLATLAEIAALAGLRDVPAAVSTDSGDAATFAGNCNGGFYSMPLEFAEAVSRQWRKWAMWMQEHIEPLKRAGGEVHLDQVALWLMLHKERIAFQPCRSNLNYFVHHPGPHRYFDPRLPISVLHYHDDGMNWRGLIEPVVRPRGAAAQAIERANAQIARHYDERLLRDWRDGTSSGR